MGNDMIHHFEPPVPLAPEGQHGFQWLPAISAGLMAGTVLLMIPQGSPWSGVTFFAPMIGGRLVPAGWGMPLALTMMIHLAGAVVYGVIISFIVKRVTQMRALIIGVIAGLALYLINLGIVRASFPEMRGDEISVLFAHIVFGAIAAGAYRGLLRRKAALTTEAAPL